MTSTRSILALAVLACAGAGCSSSNAETRRAHGAPTDTASAAGASLASASDARTIVVTAHDYSFSGVPARLHAGWLTFRLANAGAEVHMLGIARVPSGHSAHAVLDAIAHARAVPETSDWGGPNAVSPGDTATATLFFPAGDYVLSCFVESADGKIHAVRGMMAIMTVTGGSDSSSPPPSALARPDASVMLTDYHVAVQGALTAGDRTVRVQNGASRGHDLEILEILPGHSAADALRWFEHPAREAPAARAIGGVVAIHPGQQALVSVTLRPGKYLFLCWVPDDAGRPHFRRGMQQAITVLSAR